MKGETFSAKQIVLPAEIVMRQSVLDMRNVERGVAPEKRSEPAKATGTSTG
jgi:hypothetical protein